MKKKRDAKWIFWEGAEEFIDVGIEKRFDFKGSVELPVMRWCLKTLQEEGYEADKLEALAENFEQALRDKPRAWHAYFFITVLGMLRADESAMPKLKDVSPDRLLDSKLFLSFYLGCLVERIRIQDRFEGPVIQGLHQMETALQGLQLHHRRQRRRVQQWRKEVQAEAERLWGLHPDWPKTHMAMKIYNERLKSEEEKLRKLHPTLDRSKLDELLQKHLDHLRQQKQWPNANTIRRRIQRP